MSHRIFAWFVLAALAAAGSAPTANAEIVPLRLAASPRVDPGRFRSTVFATGLHFPYGMQPLADGSLLVATSRPHTIGGSYFNSVGELVRLVDANRDGVADSPPRVVRTGLPGALTALTQAGKLVFVTSSQPGRERITILRRDRTPHGYRVAGKLDFSFPASWWHTTYALAARAVGDKYRLLFNVGSSDNASQSDQTVTVSGVVSGALVGASIYELRLSFAGGRLRATGLRRVASGLRNAAGLALQPATGDLYLADNGIDGLVDVDEPHSADELNLLRAAELASRPVESFGFPASYVEYRTGDVVGGTGSAPIAAFQPLGDPPSESEGVAQIALAPAGFPDGANNGVFAGFHGKFWEGGLSNEENPVVYHDLARGEYFHFISNDEVAVGHLNGLAASAESLFLADMSSNGSIGADAAGLGVVYQISPR